VYGAAIGKWYDLIRQQLIDNYGFEYIDKTTGKIKDLALLDLVIMPEFGGMKGLDSKAYESALSGLSSQYYSKLQPLPGGHAICYGSCS
jgi:hypothetical protein